MNFNEFEEVFGKRYWLKEFREEFKLLDGESLEKLSRHIVKYEQLKEEKQALLGLYDFSLFLFKLLYQYWSGYLNPDLVYISTKILVVQGLNNEARKISRGFDFNAGCCTWRLASFYRSKLENRDQTELDELKNQIEFYFESLHTYSKIVKEDLLTWIVAFTPISDCYYFYEKHKNEFKTTSQFSILIERLLETDVKKATIVLNDMNKITDMTEYEEILFNNKKAVIAQLKGDQKQALNYFEIAESEAEKIQDYFNRSKISFNQGSSCFLLGDYELSLHYYQKAEDSYKLLGDKIGVGKCYNSLTAVYNALGEYIIAEKFIKLAEQIFAKSENKPMRDGLLYKHASILNVQGSYKKALQLLNLYTSEEPSILAFEISLLRIIIKFEQDREFNESDIIKLLNMSKDIEYILGKGNVLFYWSKMLIYQGDLVVGQKKLEESYRIFQSINYSRSKPKTLNLFAFIEMMQGRIESAESYCETALDQSKNTNLYLEGIESNILLSNIFFLKGEETKAINVIDSVLFSLETKKIKNNQYLQALVAKCSFELLSSHSTHSTSFNLIKLSKIAKNSGLYFQHQSRLLEAQEFLLNKDYLNAMITNLEILSISENFEITFLAHKLYIKSLIGSMIVGIPLQSLAGKSIVTDVEKSLKFLSDTVVKKHLVLKSIEFEFLEVLYQSAIGKEATVAIKLQQLEQKLQSTGLFFYQAELQKFKNTKSNLVSLVEPDLEISYLLT